MVGDIADGPGCGSHIAVLSVPSRRVGAECQCHFEMAWPPHPTVRVHDTRGERAHMQPSSAGEPTAVGGTVPNVLNSAQEGKACHVRSGHSPKMLLLLEANVFVTSSD